MSKYIITKWDCRYSSILLSRISKIFCNLLLPNLAINIFMIIHLQKKIGDDIKHLDESIEDLNKIYISHNPPHFRIPFCSLHKQPQSSPFPNPFMQSSQAPTILPISESLPAVFTSSHKPPHFWIPSSSLHKHPQSSPLFESRSAVFTCTHNLPHFSNPFLQSS